MKVLSKISIIRTIGILLMVGLVSIGFAISGEVFADNEPENHLTVSPMTQSISLIPGETYEGTVKVSSGVSSVNQMSYEVNVGPYNPVRGNGRDDYDGIDVTTESNRNIMTEWTTIENPSGTLEPNTTDVISFKIEVPEDAPAGSQYISILVSDNTSDEKTDDQSGGSSASIKSKIQLASVVFANVAGETVEKGSITENSIPSFLLNNQLETSSMVKNEGNIYTDASYTLQVWPMFSGEEICTNEEEPETNLVLPDTERYHSQTCNLPAVGIFKAKQVVKIFGEESVIEKMVIVCPIWLLFLIIFVIAALVIWIVMKIRAGKKNSKKTEE